MGSPWIVVVGLAALLLLGLAGGILLRGPGSGGQAPTAPPSPPDMTLPEVLAGVLLLELEPTLAVTPQQARILQEQLPLARQAVDPKTRNSGNLAGLLVVYFLENLRPEQIQAMRTQRALLEVYLPKSAGGGATSQVVDDLEALLAKRAGGDMSPASPSTRTSPASPGASPTPAPATSPTSTGSPGPKSPPGPGETRLRDLTRGLLKIAMAKPLQEAQASELLAVVPDLRLALKALPPEAGGVDPRAVSERIRGILGTEQWEEARAGQSGVRDSRGQRASDEQVLQELQRLLQARAQGRPARSEFRLGAGPGPAARPSPPPEAPAPGQQPPAPAAGAEDFPDLIFQRLLPAVETLPAGDPRLALTPAQKSRLRTIMPGLDQAVAAMATEPRSEAVARAEFQLKQILTREQLAWLEAHSSLEKTGALKAHLDHLRKAVGAPSGDAR